MCVKCDYRSAIVRDHSVRVMNGDKWPVADNLFRSQST